MTLPLRPYATVKHNVLLMLRTSAHTTCLLILIAGKSEIS
jgi:hypothetical protein